MCRCCQTCWEDFYWNCFEERFCYDESIANYNPEEDENYIAAHKAGNALALAAATQHRANNNNNNNNNHLMVPDPICQQPLRGGHATSLKIHEEDFRRETQTNVPMLGPEILSVFANSQIFQDHQPTKLSRINTKTHLAGIHSNGVSASPSKEIMATSALAAAAVATALTTAAEQERLIRSLEANLNDDVTDATMTVSDQFKTPTVMWEDLDVTPEKRITFTLTSTNTSPTDSIQTLNSKKFYTISEEQSDIDHARQQQQQQQHNQLHYEKAASMESEISNSDEVILRPHLMPHYPSNLLMQLGTVAATKKRSLRTVKSVPHLNMRTISGDVDIFSITGSTGGSQMSISMTPEVPSISFANLPKNYVDTPTIEKYRVSQSLYAIQSANEAARAMQDDFSMPRYFGKSGLVSHSIDGLQPSASTSQLSSMDTSASTKQMNETIRRPELVKSKRLQMLRSNLAPLLIHSVSFKRNRGDESKQVD